MLREGGCWGEHEGRWLKREYGGLEMESNSEKDWSQRGMLGAGGGGCGLIHGRP